MSNFRVRFKYLESHETTVLSADARGAARTFFEEQGGLRGNYGRCVITENMETAEKADWACIRLFGDEAALYALDADGEPLPGQARIEDYEKLKRLVLNRTEEDC